MLALDEWVRLREAVLGVGGILGCRVSERRGRWFVSVGGLLRKHRIARALAEAALGRLVGMVRHEAEALGALALGASCGIASTKRCGPAGRLAPK